MRKLLLAMAFTASLGSIAEAQQVADPRVVDIARAGKVRIALFLPQYTKDAVTGELRGGDEGGIILEMARAFAAHLSIPLQLIEYPTPPRALAGLIAGESDVVFMGRDASRTDVDFSPPFLQLDYTYLVAAGSSLQSGAGVDAPGVRIAAVRNHASTLALSRIMKQANLVYADTPDRTFDLLRTGQADVMASTRVSLVSYSAQLPGSRVLEDRYGANLLSMAVPKGHAERLAYVSEFIEKAKTSGLVQRAIERTGLRGFQVVPPAKPN